MNFKYNEKYSFIEFKQRDKRKNTIIWLSKTQSRLFNVLKDRQEHSYKELIKAMYDIQDDSFYIKNVRTNIKRLNDKLKNFGKVKNIRGIGYKLEINE